MILLHAVLHLTFKTVGVAVAVAVAVGVGSRPEWYTGPTLIEALRQARTVFSPSHPHFVARANAYDLFCLFLVLVLVLVLLFLCLKTSVRLM